MLVERWKLLDRTDTIAALAKKVSQVSQDRSRKPGTVGAYTCLAPFEQGQAVGALLYTDILNLDMKILDFVKSGGQRLTLGRTVFELAFPL